MVSERAAATSPFTAMEVLERANELDDVIHLEVGEPDFQPPAAVVEAAVRSLRAGNTGYTTSRGKPALREAIRDYYDDRYGVDVPTDRIVVTPGSSPALLIAFLTTVDPGEEVVLTDPHYACYPNFVRQAGGRISTVPLDHDDGFTPVIGRFDEAISDRTAALMLNSPANPTGAVIPGDDLAALTRLAGRHDTTIVCDEVYHGLDYGDRAPSVLEYTDEAFVVDGFSKRFAMTGWRLGWMVCPPDSVDAVNRLAQNLLICAPNFVQDAGEAALREAADTIPAVRELYRERRDLVVDRIEDLGLGLGYTPGGAYYLLVDVRDSGDAFAVADALLESAGVALTPGADFGERAEPFLRLSYAASTADLEEGLDRIERALETATV